MNYKLYERLLKLPKKNILHLMEYATNEMQLCNYRSVDSCIVSACGGEYDSATGKCRIPSLKKIRENTDDGPLFYEGEIT